MLEPGEEICPKITKNECVQLIDKLYGYKCLDISELNGYDDKNYKVVLQKHPPNGEQRTFVLKILNRLDSKKLDFIDAQHAMMAHLVQRGINCPQPEPTLQGGCYSLEVLISGEHVIRLMHYIDGYVLHEVPPTVALFYQVGRFLGQMDNALETFSHSAYDTYQSLWHLDNVPKLKHFLTAIVDPIRMKQFAKIIEDFQREVLPIRSTLPDGYIHGDFNQHNIIISHSGGEITGVLDFGDTQKSAYVYELAIAMTYMMIVSGKMEMGGPVMAGYQEVHPISEKEAKLLRICILARMSQSIVMGAYSAHLHPENATYLLTCTSERTWRVFEAIYAKNNEELIRIWKQGEAEN